MDMRDEMAEIRGEVMDIYQDKLSDKWECLLFGSNDFIYMPREGYEPSIFIRFMMRLCFDCKWVRKEKK
jgi:hypothetical protein